MKKPDIFPTPQAKGEYPQKTREYRQKKSVTKEENP